MRYPIAGRGFRRSLETTRLAPDRTLVVAPDNQSRRDLNDHIRSELKTHGDVAREDHKVSVLVPRQDMTGADRAWAARYHEGDVVRYTKGSHQLGIKPGEYATVREVDGRNNTLKVEFKDRSENAVRPTQASRRGRLRNRRTKLLARRQGPADRTQSLRRRRQS